MSQKHTFNEAMNQLHASDDLYARVMQQARGDKRKRRGTARPIAAVATAALIATAGVGGTAYAVINSDFSKRRWETTGSALRANGRTPTPACPIDATTE